VFGIKFIHVNNHLAAFTFHLYVTILKRITARDDIQTLQQQKLVTFSSVTHTVAVRLNLSTAIQTQTRPANKNKINLIAFL